MFGLGPQEMFVLVVFGIILFGKRLPEVGRSIGRTVSEFRNSLRGVEQEFSGIMDGVDRPVSPPPAPPRRPPQRLTPTAPKFQDPVV
jgi:sec-independent protein translocase protein TatA